MSLDKLFVCSVCYGPMAADANNDFMCLNNNCNELMLPRIDTTQSFPPHFDERQTVDPDVAALIPEHATVFVGHLTVLQLIKEIRLLREALAAGRDKT